MRQSGGDLLSHDVTGFIWILLKALKTIGDDRQVDGFRVSHSMLVDIEVSLALAPKGTRAFFGQW